jgi:hypothetical protein
MMVKRKKIYYPDSQIEKNLFTEGKEWMYLKDWKEYRGFYHKYTNGEVFTEREWDPNRSEVLVPYKQKSDSYFRYLDIKQYSLFQGQKYQNIGPQKFYTYTAPRAVQRLPTDIETQNGFMERVFVYKRNERNRVMFEVDAKQIENFEKDNTGINQYLYGYVKIPWKLDGPERDIFDGSTLKTPGVIDTNQRIIDRFSKKFPILRSILTNPREHSKYDR